METEDERRARLENDEATKRLRLNMETEEERKSRLVKMVATTQLRLAPETEDERRARLEYLSNIVKKLYTQASSLPKIQLDWSWS